MKRMSFIGLVVLMPGVLLAQNSVSPQTIKKNPKPVSPTKAAPPLLKNLIDSASYAVGVSVANFYKQQGITRINGSLVSKAINDQMSGGKMLMDESTANAVMNRYMSQMQAEKSKPTIQAGQKFLTQNKLRKEVITTASGLQYEVLQEGSGEKPGPTDSVTCHYRGTFLDGRGFDNSYDRGEPITFPLNGVIPGWTEGLQLMSVGSKYKFYIPYKLGYGEFDMMSIPGGSTLVFEVELLGIKRAQASLEAPKQ
ncbi:MAG: FKBP-type peptidyl-prolyl cis-trans isomerase [Bacteroidota bacterium]